MASTLDTASTLAATMPPQAWRRLVAEGRPRHWARGATIYPQGSPGHSMLLVRTGRVEITVVDAEGRPSALNLMGPGDLVGEVALLDGGTRSASAVASTEVTGVVIERSALRAFLARDPDGALALIAELCAKLRHASAIAETRARPSGRARLARCLLQLADRPDDRSGAVLEGLSQSALGAHAGLTRESVNRILRGWAAEGLVELDGAARRIRIHDAAALARRTE
ncbi:Crp/Fnr family transcriptional regulator [Jannaschia sp. Os4]|uniref:Crp/Fnr family transcriptional regulator n=1 Tax=Jannaschia sp. Os4 TaxID=2807617 RepID=UPI0019393985|nr:Crp/Fnr family transcriptional regulator [Jannaschia sp. Os4]MBM2576346.1 Crp/Fnr family transcriptional regulator [Jannaschia sp. Os4]